MPEGDGIDGGGPRPAWGWASASPWRRGFRAVDRQLRTDPNLNAAGVTIRSWNGEPGDMAGPSAAVCPWIRITPKARSGSGDWESEGWQRADLTIAIETAVAGTNCDLLMDLWWAIVLALFPPLETSRRAEALRIRDEAITPPARIPVASGHVVTCWGYEPGRLRLTTPAIEPIVAPGGGAMLMGRGELTLTLSVATP